jgi:hypothetical protein
MGKRRTCSREVTLNRLATQAVRFAEAHDLIQGLRADRKAGSDVEWDLSRACETRKNARRGILDIGRRLRP